MHARQASRAQPAVRKSMPWWDWPAVMVEAVLDLVGVLLAMLKEILRTLFAPTVWLD